MAVCEVCLKVYSRNSHLRRHILHAHRGTVPPPPLKAGRKAKQTSTFKCMHCSKTFATKNNEARHRKATHRDRESVQSRDRLATDDGSVAATRKTVIRGVQAEKATLVFQSITEFLGWKSAEEERTSSRYCKVRADVRNTRGVVRRTYQCHRSGAYRPRGKGRRSLKVQGSCKIGAVCPASIYVRILPTRVVHVDYFAKHRGHPVEVAHLTLNQEQREEIARKLAVGIPFDDVLDTTQWGSASGQLTALNLITRKTLHNITASFGISRGAVLHRDDAESVTACVEQTRQGPVEKNIVRFVKFQGEEGEAGLGVNDFMLVIMTDVQVMWLKKFGGSMKELAMDSTLGTNEYDYITGC